MDLQTAPHPPPHAGAPAAPQAFIPTRGQRLALPLSMGALAACGCAAVALADPGDDGVPICWSRSLLGVDCPFCGGLRCTNALMRGRLGDAFDHNVLLAAALPVTVLFWVWWMWSSWRGGDPPLRRVPGWLAVTAAVLLIVFGIVRNTTGTPLGRWLYSDLSVG